MEDVALNLVLQMNNPFSPDRPSIRRSASRHSARTRSRCPSRALQNTSRQSDRRDPAYIHNWKVNNIPIGLEYERIARKKNFWQQFANEKAREWLRDSDRGFPKREPLYTARCGPKPLFVRSSSIESLATDISLLSISSGSDGEREVKRPKRKRNWKANESRNEVETRPSTKQQPRWESFVNEKKGILDEMIQKDAANLQGFVKGKVIDRTRAIDIMSEEERNLLTSCCYTIGIAGKEKSASTENLISFYHRSQPKSVRKVVSRERHGTIGSVLDGSGRTPSPRSIIEQTKRTKHRPKSAVDLPFGGSAGNRHDFQVTMENGPKFPKRVDPKSDCQKSRSSSLLPSIDGRIYGKKTSHKIRSTINALNRTTGYGDPTSVIASQEDEKHFTPADYGKTLRYPQRIRVAPSLARVIREDLKTRVGRPRRKEIKTRDVKIFDMDGPKLGRSYRNLIIFDWLHNVDEDNYEITVPPMIEDLEGERPRTRAFPTLAPGIVGENGATPFPFSRGRSVVSPGFANIPYSEVFDVDTCSEAED